MRSLGLVLVVCTALVAALFAGLAYVSTKLSSAPTGWTTGGAGLHCHENCPNGDDCGAIKCLAPDERP